MTWYVPAEFTIAIFLGLGLIVGSFLNVVIHRMPLMILHEGDEPGPNLCVPGSHCPSCGNALRWYHNIPVLSYLVLRGKCGWCSAPISMRYPMVEVLTAAVWLICLFAFGDLASAQQAPLKPLLWAVIASMFIAMVFIDAETMLLPDQLTIGVLWLGLLAALWGLSGVSISQAIYGAAAGYIFMRAFIFAGDTLMRQPSMGQGDAKLVAGLGALFGPVALPPILLLASLSGLGIYLVLKLRGKIGHGYVPFGPSLIFGALAHAMGASAFLRLI